MSRIEGPASAPSLPAEPDFAPAASAHRRNWRDVFARPRDRSVIVTNEEVQGNGADERDDLERYVNEARDRLRAAQARARFQPPGLPASARTRSRTSRSRIDGEADNSNGTSSEDDAQMRRLGAMHRGTTGDDTGGNSQQRSGAQQVRLFAPSAVRSGIDLRTAHPVRLALARIEGVCREAQASAAPRQYFIDRLDDSLRDVLLLLAQATAAGGSAAPMLAEIFERLGTLYARHARGLRSTLAHARAELMHAFADWRAPADRRPCLEALLVAVPAAYLAIRDGRRWVSGEAA